jgi:hypothetical protein
LGGSLMSETIADADGEFFESEHGQRGVGEEERLAGWAALGNGRD